MLIYYTSINYCCGCPPNKGAFGSAGRTRFPFNHLLYQQVIWEHLQMGQHTCWHMTGEPVADNELWRGYFCWWQRGLEHKCNLLTMIDKNGKRLVYTLMHWVDTSIHNNGSEPKVSFRIRNNCPVGWSWDGF